MKYNLLPISLNITDANILIVGGGNVAIRKLKVLQQFTNKVTIVGAKIDDSIKYSGCKFFEKTYDINDLAKANIVFACTNNLSVNKEIKTDCFKRKILVNVAGNSGISDFYSSALFITDNKISFAVNSIQKTFRKAIGMRNRIQRMFENNTSFVNQTETSKKSSQVFLPILINMNKKKALIIGNNYGTDKKMKIVSKYVKNIVHIKDNRNIVEKNLNEYFLIYDCTNNAEFNEAIRRICTERRILLNVHDQARLCDFVSPAIYMKS
ncbi:MAG: hypothetical protein L3J74_13965, partial [Bacteroidales bacterium]|nr:hypothetical protein [Bacteroidales bacterium]